MCSNFVELFDVTVLKIREAVVGESSRVFYLCVLQLCVNDCSDLDC